MKKATLKTATILALATAVAAPALASNDSGFYVGSYIGAMSASNSDTATKGEKDQKIKGNFRSLGVKAGYDFNSIFGAELRYSRDNGKVQKKSGQSLAVDHQTGLYGKAKFNVTNNIELYGLAGVNNIRLKQAGFASNDNKKTINSFSYGVGAQYNFSDSLGANVELMKLSNHKQFDAQSINLGLNYRF
ncbi:porin family protein [Vibrio hangzhouensis]|uniref:Outer membrane insertion C-terminal signal n=1 Tax=Vibrio hangzhouensis TaxID=462991 RepID=A0A1H6AVE5_9VIBR|nr:porin family protein [Vibrio hangzhouensis]SEG52658.1 outer membrane insertion C-terminal signal [Vibrio hangzhouensis]SEG65141.1 outer membrane insertion C-terminal signal [Vibrio hangzhouensis]